MEVSHAPMFEVKPPLLAEDTRNCQVEVTRSLGLMREIDFFLRPDARNRLMSELSENYGQK